jgi:hypothetical protein
MNQRLFVCVALLAVFCGAQFAQATVWDAYTDYAAGDQGSVWHYLYMDGQSGLNGPYTQMATYTPIPYGGYTYQIWDPDATFTRYFAKIDGYMSDLRTDFGADATTVLAWTSPVSGYVNLSFAVRLQVDGCTEADYALFENNGTTALSSGVIDSAITNASMNTHTFTNVPVSVGTTFYLQMSPGANISCDTLGVTMTVSTVPEPSTLAILASTLVGMLAYAWRKRK